MSGSIRNAFRVVRVPYFWLLVLLELSVAFLYYSGNISGGARFPWFRLIEAFEYLNSFHGSLFVIPLLGAAIVFRVRGAVITWLVSFAIILPVILYYHSSVGVRAINIGYSVVPLLIIVYSFVQSRERTGTAQREKERRIYASQILKGQEDERRRIAQELHDGLIQDLLVIANRAQAALDGRDIAKEVRDSLASIRDMALHTASDARQLSLDLRPSVLDDMGLVPALRFLADSLSRETGMHIQFIVTGSERRLSDEKEIAIFRIAQEALNNARRHSNADAVELALSFGTRSVGLRIRDDGGGFAVPDRLGSFVVEGKLGLFGMRQRASSINGHLTVQSEPNGGTSISLQAPEKKGHEEGH